MSIDVEERLATSLRRRAGQAPAPTGEDRRRVHERAGALRRRRTGMRVVAVAAASSLVVGAAVWQRAGDDAGHATIYNEPHMDPPHRGAWPDPPPGDGTLPEFAVAGYVTTSSVDVPPREYGESDDHTPSQSRVYREPGNYSGPVVGVAYFGDCGACNGFRPGLPPEHGTEEVPIGDRQATLWTLAPDGRILHWTLPGGGSFDLFSRGLTTAEAVALARGLERRGDADFVARDLPQGLVEDSSSAPEQGQPSRLEWLEAGDQFVNISVERGDGQLVEGITGPFAANSTIDRVEHITVLGRPAVLLHSTGKDVPDGLPSWTVVWRHSTDVVVEAIFDGSDRAAAGRIVAGIHEVP